MPKRVSAAWRPILLSLAIFAVNLFICHELFGIEFLDNLNSNDGAFISLARFYREHGTGYGWFPWFNAGMPIENAYQPLLPALAAVVSRIGAWPIARAFHFVLALFYCAGPVALFWFAWEWSESLFVAGIAGFAYSLTSPAELLVPILRIPFHGQWGALRLHNLIYYAEDPHNVALTLLPVALLCLHRAMVRRDAPNIVAAIVASSAVVLTNAFGAVDLALGGLCMALALNGGLAVLVPVGAAAYLWISPWLPPSLIEKMRHDQWGARGYFNSGASALLSAAGAAAVFALLWFIGRRLKSTLERFSILFAFCMCIIPLGFFLLNMTMVPQGSRYQLEMEMALCLWFACLCVHIPRRALVTSVLAAAALWQTVLFREYAVALIRPANIPTTIEYKVDRWLGNHLPGQRVMISGDPEYLYNVWSDSPQMAGGHEPTAPNWEQLVAIYTIYTGANAGDRDAEYSLLWLKAFGNRAVYVAGAKSREFYHAIAHPHKFDGLLPVLWHDEDDTIFAVPQRSASLAHVIPDSAAVSREPVNGLDVDPIRPYVAALDDPAMPLAEMQWDGTSQAIVRAPVQRGQELSVQINHAPGWHATVRGREVPVRKDGIGLILIQPGCSGPCEVRLEYRATAEAWACRMLCALMSFGLAALLARAFWRDRLKAERV